MKIVSNYFDVGRDYRSVRVSLKRNVSFSTPFFFMLPQFDLKSAFFFLTIPSVFFPEIKYAALFMPVV